MKVGKPLRVSRRWVGYAHDLDAEDRQPMAIEMCNLLDALPAKQDFILVPVVG